MNEPPLRAALSQEAEPERDGESTESAERKLQPDVRRNAGVSAKRALGAFEEGRHRVTGKDRADEPAGERGQWNGKQFQEEHVTKLTNRSPQ
jgi:hypothetical protein